MIRSLRSRIALVLSLLSLTAAAPGPGEPPVAAAPPAASAERDDSHLLDRIAFIGASATAGFGVIARDPEARLPVVPVSFAACFRGICARPVETHDLGTSFFFANPGGNGRSAVERALAKRPTLVVGVDFLFWYVYGADDGRGGSLPDEAARLTKLEVGLAELDRIPKETPLVLGDLPNMESAVGKMLSRSQMPAPATIAKANERIAAWAEARGNVILFPLATLVEDLKAGRTIVAGGVEFVPTAGRLIQSDDLHPTFRGSLAMGFLLADRLKAHYGDAIGLVTPPDESAAAERARAAAREALDRRAGRPAETAPAPSR
jgi:hypothetical protein